MSKLRLCTESLVECFINNNGHYAGKQKLIFDRFKNEKEIKTEPYATLTYKILYARWSSVEQINRLERDERQVIITYIYIFVHIHVNGIDMIIIKADWFNNGIIIIIILINYARYRDGCAPQLINEK